MQFHGDDQDKDQDYPEMGSPPCSSSPQQINLPQQINSPTIHQHSFPLELEPEISELDVFLNSMSLFDNDQENNENKCENENLPKRSISCFDVSCESPQSSSESSMIQKTEFFTFEKKLGVTIFIYPPYGEDQNEYVAFIADDGRTVVSLDGYAFENNFDWTQYIVNQYHFSHFKNEQEKQEFESEFDVEFENKNFFHHGNPRTFTPFEETSFESIFQNI